jgi:hypothetical protein
MLKIHFTYAFTNPLNIILYRFYLVELFTLDRKIYFLIIGHFEGVF